MADMTQQPIPPYWKLGIASRKRAAARSHRRLADKLEREADEMEAAYEAEVAAG